VRVVRELAMEQDLLNYAAKMQCQELHLTVDEATGLQAIIAIHDVTLGPALGGCRLLEYPSTLSAAVDAIRLARGMTYKAALMRLPLGGGKMVILKPAKIIDRVAFFKSVGKAVDLLNGRYITAVDSGTSVEDMDIVASATPHVTCTSKTEFSLADPSVMTGAGVVRGIQAAVRFRLGRDSLEGIHVAIQGLGHAGYALAKDLHALGARLTVFDVKFERMMICMKEFKADIVSHEDVLFSLKCDVFAPSALGAVLNDRTIPKLNTRIVAGCANNQLAEPRHGEALRQRGILYAPDIAVNAGGVIYVAAQLSHIRETEAAHKIDHIYDTLMEIFQRAEDEGRPTNEIADAIARERLRPYSFPDNCFGKRELFEGA